MSFFQNLFDQEFRGNWVLSDRKYSLTFTCPANRNTSNWQAAYNYEPFDLSSDNTLTLNYAWDIDFKKYTALAINVAGATAAATLASEVVDKLNANPTFATMWVAEILKVDENKTICIRSKTGRVKPNIRLWISNSSAEKKLRFNKKAGVSELPDYFDRHTISNVNNYSDGMGLLVKLDETDATVDRPIIADAGFDYSAMKEDWELLNGRASGLFTFQKLTVDVSDRITEVIEYPAGAKEGDFARKIQYSYTSTNKNPDQVTEIPYILQSGDLVTP